MAAIGRLPETAGGGLFRRPFSSSERSARSLFCTAALQAGLSVATDGAANLSAHLPCGPAGASTLLLGSHLDTVPGGGPYDGAFGVIAALEVLQVVAEHHLPMPFHLEAIAFTDEEGHFGDYFGSRALAGIHTASTISSFLGNAAMYPEDLAQLPASEVTEESIILARRQPAALAGYLELHIEQGPVLERAGIPIGIVTSIFGRTSFILVFHGRQDHAGTTPMNLRADALLAASQFVNKATARVCKKYPGAVITCGNLKVKPGVCNVIPGLVELHLEFRAGNDAEIDNLWTEMVTLAKTITKSNGITCTLVGTDHQPPVPMSPLIQEIIEKAADDTGYRTMYLPSGAGHDAQILAGITPTGMIFVPSKDGRSHCPEEDTKLDDLLTGAEVLLATVIQLRENV